MDKDFLIATLLFVVFIYLFYDHSSEELILKM